MRRANCEITDRDEMIKILNSTSIGSLATVDIEGYPYVTPVNFVFHEGSIFFHSAPKGEKLDNISRDARVCFEVDVSLAYLEVGFNPEKNPCRAHQLYYSVIIRGKARVISDGELKTRALNALVRKHEGNNDFIPINEGSPEYKGCRVIEIKPEKMTAKSDVAQSNPQRAYRRFIAESLAKRGLPTDVEAIQAMGYELEGKTIKDP